MSLMHILLNSIDADIKSEIGSSRGGLRPYPLRFHVEEAGADAKLNQHGPLGVAYHFFTFLLSNKISFKLLNCQNKSN
jgi:hypothetical protein